MVMFRLSDLDDAKALVTSGTYRMLTVLPLLLPLLVSLRPSLPPLLVSLPLLLSPNATTTLVGTSIQNAGATVAYVFNFFNQSPH